MDEEFWFRRRPGSFRKIACMHCMRFEIQQSRCLYLVTSRDFPSTVHSKERRIEFLQFICNYYPTVPLDRCAVSSSTQGARSSPDPDPTPLETHPHRTVGANTPLSLPHAPLHPDLHVHPPRTRISQYALPTYAQLRPHSVLEV